MESIRRTSTSLAIPSQVNLNAVRYDFQLLLPFAFGTPHTLHRLLLLTAFVVHLSFAQLRHLLHLRKHGLYPRCSLRSPRRQAGPSTVIHRRRLGHYWWLPVFRLSRNVYYSTFSSLAPAFFLSLFNATSSSERLIVMTRRRIIHAKGDNYTQYDSERRDLIAAG